MSPGAPGIQEGQMYKVPTSIGQQINVGGNSVLYVYRTPENTDADVEMHEGNYFSILRISRGILGKLDRIVKIAAGDSFRIPGNMEIPPFLKEKGISPKATITVCADPDPTNPGGLVEVQASGGVKFSILADILSKFNRKRTRENRRKTA